MSFLKYNLRPIAGDASYRKFYKLTQYKKNKIIIFAKKEKYKNLIAYSAGTGGSMLIIGSAAGVVAMGMEKIDFFWYLKKIAWLAFAGFISGFVSFILLRDFVL